MQVNDEDRDLRGGFGMGLAIVKQFVDSLGYKLAVHSVPNRGTVFRLLVPLVNSGRRATKLSPRPAPRNPVQPPASMPLPPR